MPLTLIPLILQPARLTDHSNTLIDNIFSNVIDPDIISGNLTATISDHLPQFSIIASMFGNIPGNKSNMKETGPNLIKKILFYFSVEWGDLLKNAGNSTKKFLDKINMHQLKELKNISWNLSLNLG